VPRLDKTAADYIAIAVGPALIMLLVGSLIFFLLEVFYQGQFEGRLQFILSAFVFAAVLIGRISIESSTERAALFAIPLGMLVAIAISRFVEHRGALANVGLYLDWGLLGLIWWCAHKLVWDCTVIDEQQDASGQGLLQMIGLDREAAQSPANASPAAQLPEGTTAADDSQPALSGWHKWLQTDRGRPHAPGVWVVYFSLAALPIFGIGQLFVPVNDLERRQHVFRLLLMYVASGLGLLLTTSFLGIRRYLRQRNVEMPLRIARNWIGVGCVLGAALLAFAMLLPRPNAEYAVSSITGQVGSPDREASRYAAGGQGAKDKSNLAKNRSDDSKQKLDSKQFANSGTMRTKQGDKTPSPESSKQSGSSKEPSSKEPGDKSSGGKESSGKESSGKQGEKEPGSKEPSAGNDEATGKEEGAKKQGSSSGAGQPKKPADDQRSSQNQAGTKTAGSKSAAKSSGSSAPSKTLLRHVTESAGSLGTLLKWLLYAVLLVVAVYFGWKYRAELAAGFVGLLNDLKHLWQSLLGGKKISGEDEPAEQTAAAGPAPRPFAAYANPFSSGLAAQLSTDELIAYTFEALEAWAREHGCPREPDETPQEFAAHVAAAAEPLAQRVRRLAQLYSQVCYAPDTVQLADPRELEALWREMGRG
jgi:hypothetical protein